MDKRLKELALQAGLWFDSELSEFWIANNLELERFYENAVIEGMAKQMHSSVDRAVNAMGKEWVSLSVNEGRDFFESKLTRAELITEISEFLEKKNGA